VRTNEKIAEYIALDATTAAILNKSLASQEQRGPRYLRHSQLEFVEHLFKRFDGGKRERQLRVDDGVDSQLVHPGLCSKLGDRPVGPFGIVFQHVDQNVRVNQDQALPRSKAIRS